MTPVNRQQPRWLVAVPATVIAVALLVAGGAVAVVTGVGAPTVPAEGSVDAGFARDMSTHHRQAVTVAGLVRDRSDDSEIQVLGYDVESTQNNQIGMMQGWLQVWGLSVNTSAEQMAWMSGHQGMGMSGGVMPGMATPDKLDELRGLSGDELGVRFLQLMIRHHQGAVPMADYALAHADTDVVRRLAQKVIESQSAEVLTMEQMLRERGGSVLPPP
ncbi:MAG: DUF305 domain-containing protein [Geodermatophilaceae bacterium]|nr:DUF305 domain-containing protein [Geodermatophilaceae bacterium]